MIVKTLSKIYGARYSIKEIKIRGHKKAKPTTYLTHKVYTIKTNNKAREIAKKDLDELFSNKISKDSLSRLNKFSKLMKKEFLKEVK